MHVKSNSAFVMLRANLAQEQSFPFLFYRIVKGGHFVAVRFNPGRKTSATFVYMAEVISVAEEQVTVKYMRKQGNSM